MGFKIVHTKEHAGIPRSSTLHPTGIGTLTVVLTMLALDAMAPKNVKPTQSKAKNRVENFASLSVFDRTRSGVPINIASPVVGYAGIMSKSIVPRAVAKARARTTAMELKIVDAPSEPLISSSVL
ncbi:hypothetical protein CVT26_001341 [Gymnopilus dilepis]|uniref:Uncharacterized protein n=1 Tax=Gymnopilus dilepis TaxID=231916 RepID=A0A409YUN0_9AGAR|nr:hypothetical protein CVT26_001341 [Gymnopilus dilepis]